MCVFIEKYRHKKRVSLLHRAATTNYPCCDQALGEFIGSWPCRTYPTTKIHLFILNAKILIDLFLLMLQKSRVQVVCKQAVDCLLCYKLGVYNYYVASQQSAIYNK